jgi:hypothetical protein
MFKVNGQTKFVCPNQRRVSMKSFTIEAIVAVAIVASISSPVLAKKSNKSKSKAAETVEVIAAAATPAPRPPATAHTGVFTVEAGGVVYTCHNYCAGNTLTAVNGLY